LLNEKLNEWIEEEIERRCSDLKQEISEVKNKYLEINKLLEDLRKENSKLKQNTNQIEAFAIFKSLINDVNFGNILLHFNLKRNNYNINGMHSENIPSWFKFLFTYYEDKEKLFSIMDLFNFKYPNWAKNYKMPYEYNEEELELFIDPKYDRYICNGEIFNNNIGFFWENIQYNQGDTYKILTTKQSFSDDIPWQLVLSNPLWKEEKLFNKILNVLNKKQKDSHYYYAIQNYQTISEDQAKEMAKYLPKDKLYDIHKTFISNNKNIIKNNEWLAEHFKGLISNNQFSTFYYLNYPLQMQKDFIINCNKSYPSKFDLVNKMIINKEDKIKFLMEVAELELS
jgi:hypothetical protein